MFDGRVYVATESDTVYALKASNGAKLWSAHLGTPVPATDLPCGDIPPTVGITGTPVIDPARGEIFVVADELAQGRPAHVLTGLSTSSGRVEMTRDVDPPGTNTAALLQRTGLTLDDGRVVFGMGGNFGDCASYRGRVIAAPENGGRPRTFTIDAAPDESQGAVWMGGSSLALFRVRREAEVRELRASVPARKAELQSLTGRAERAQLREAWVNSVPRVW